MTRATLRKNERSRNNETCTSITERHYFFMTKNMHSFGFFMSCNKFAKLLKQGFQLTKHPTRDWQFLRTVKEDSNYPLAFVNLSHFSSLFNLQTEEVLTDLQLRSPHEFVIIIPVICAASLSCLDNTWCTYENEQNVIRANTIAISDMLIPIYVMRLNASSWVP